jgi:hypothetical protein
MMKPARDAGEAGAADDADPGADGVWAVATGPELQPPTASTAAASSGRTWTTVGRRACIPPDTDPGRDRFTPTSKFCRTGARAPTPRSRARAVWSRRWSGPRRSGSPVSAPHVADPSGLPPARSRCRLYREIRRRSDVRGHPRRPQLDHPPCRRRARAAEQQMDRGPPLPRTLKSSPARMTLLTGHGVADRALDVIVGYAVVAGLPILI